MKTLYFLFIIAASTFLSWATLPVYANTDVAESDRVVANSSENEASAAYTSSTEMESEMPMAGQTWYVLKNGDWSDHNTWTLDAGLAPAPNNPSDEVPATGDHVIIRNGRKVTIKAGTDNLEVASIRVDGRLNVNTTTGHDFTVIDGKGIIDIQGNAGVSNFPAGNTTGANGFADELNGGLLVVSGTGMEFDNNLTLKDLRIDLDNAADEVILGADVVLNGDFTIRKGTWQFGNSTATARNFTVYGDVLVQDNGSTREGRITTSTVNKRHKFNLYGDFINKGNAKFSQRTTQTVGNDPSDGITDFYLLSTDKDQLIRADGPTYFLRVIIDKGAPAYSAIFSAAQVSNFVLTGKADESISGDVSTEADNENAFGLISGTAVIGTNVRVDPLNTTGNYSIGTHARLLIDGGYVRKPAGTAITPYGTIEVNAGTLQAETNSGITVRGAGLLKVNGGTVNVPQFRTSIYGSTNVGGLEINGGQVNIGKTNGTNPSTGYYTLSLSYEDNAFIMTGGELNVSDATTKGLVFINSSPGNINVSGGQVNLKSTNNNLAKITSKAPFYNLTLDNANNSTDADARFAVQTGTTGSGGAARTITDPDLNVLNNLVIKTGTTRTSGSNTYGSYLDMCDGGDCNDLFVGKDLRIEDSAVLDVWSGNADNAGSSTVTFNGANDAELFIGNITTYNSNLVGFEEVENAYQGGTGDGNDTFNSFEFPFYNLTINKPSSHVLKLAVESTYNAGGYTPSINGSGAKNIYDTQTNLLQIANDFVLESGQVDIADFSVRHYGDITNKGVYGLDFDPYNAQIKTRKETSAVVRTITTTDGAEFGNLRLNSGEGIITFTSDVYVKRLVYRFGRMDIKNHNLKIDKLVFRLLSGEVRDDNFSVEDMIIMDGDPSDGGISLFIPSTENPGMNGTDPEQDQPTFANNVYFLPIGTGTTGTYPDSRYTPMQFRMKDVTSSGYVTVNVVDQQLQTAGPHPLNNDVLDRYWRIRSNDFATLPKVERIRVHATEADVAGGSLTAKMQDGGGGSWNPAFVLDNNPYTRTYESNSDDGLSSSGYRHQSISGPNAHTQIEINFWGNEWDGSAFTGNPSGGFDLFKGNFTAGNPSKFAGAPEVYYTKRPGDGFLLKWNNGANWTFGNNNAYEPHDSRQTNAGSYPEAGDIAVIGWVPYGDTGGVDGDPHGIAVDGMTARFAEIRFTKMTDISGNPTDRQYAYNFQFRPTVVINASNSYLDGGAISGEGMFWMRSEGAQKSDPNFLGIDIGGFVAEDSSYFLYESTSNAFVFDNIPETTPNLLLSGNGWGTNNRDFEVSTDVNVRGNLELLGDVNLVLSSGATGDFTVGNDLRIFRSTANGNDSGGWGLIDYPNNASRSIEVLGDLRLENQGAVIRVGNPNTTVNAGDLIVHGDIIQDNSSGGGLQLYTAANEDFIRLTLAGSGNNKLDIRAGTIPSFHSIVMNKGNSTNSSFSLKSDFLLPSPADIGMQPIEILNGLLVFDDPSIDVLLTDASRGNFNLPNLSNPESSSGSGGLELGQGSIAKIEGTNTGLILDGLLKINGGTLDMASGVGNGNNFIEYSVSGNAKIVVADGQLEVGSQLRRSLLSTSGVLNYTQTGGAARFGINAAPEQNRGVFEILNSGSQFNHTGGDLTIVRQNGSTSTGSVLLDPNFYDLTGSTITMGDASTPAGQTMIGVDATIPLNNLLITGNSSLNAKTYINPLVVSNLEVENNGTFSANGLDLTIQNDLIVDGTFTHQGDGINQQKTFFNATGAQNISGSGSISFWNVDKENAGSLTLDQEVTVENDLNIAGGVVNTKNNALNLEGDLLHDGEHQSAVAGPGIVFNGTAKQNLSRSTTGYSDFGVITVENGNGVEVTANDFKIDHKVVLSTGVFNIGSNLLIMDEDAIFENGTGGTARNDFNVNNMITVNTSLIDKGVRKMYPDNYSGSFLYPVGLLHYTPAEVSATDISGNGFITVKPIDNFSDGIANDDDELCTGGANYDDTLNVMQYYWLVKSSDVTNFDGSFTMYHNDNVESVNNSEGLGLVNYAPARLLNAGDTWDKNYTQQLFDESNNTITFQSDISNAYAGLTSATIEGRYTAGITRDNSDNLLCGSAIPNQVPLYETYTATVDGNVNVAGSFIGGEAPSVGQSPDLVVQGDYTLVLNDNFRRFRKVTIEENATLEVNATFGHNLGTVVGKGTLRLVDDAGFPAGDYESFFPDSNCSDGGGLEYENNDTGNSVTILAEGFTNLKRLILSGNGEKLMANGKSVNICNDLELQAGLFEMADNSEVRVKGNVIKSAASTFEAEYNTTSTVVMDGSTNQYIRGDFTGTQAFNILEVDKPLGRLSIVDAGNHDIEISRQVKFNSGLINTNTDNSLIIQNTADLSGYSIASHVNGPLIRNLNTSTASQFDAFPVGQSGRFGLIQLSFIKNTDDWTATYLSSNPQVDISPNSDLTGPNVVISANEYWELTSAGSNDANVTLSWDGSSHVADGSASVSQAIGELKVLRFKQGVSSEWKDMGGKDASGTATDGQLTSNTRVDFSTNYFTFGAGDADNNSLPIELVFFTAESKSNKVALNWQTASERNNDFFEVQRSYDGEHFETVGIVEGNGDSKETIDYEFNDYSPLSGDSYYRLRQVDYDGAFEYTKVEKVNRQQESDLVAVPNPTQSQQIKLRLSGFHAEQKVQVVIYDLQGRRHYQAVHTPTDFTKPLPIDKELTSGIYIIDVKQGNIRKNIRLMIR